MKRSVSELDLSDIISTILTIQAFNNVASSAPCAMSFLSSALFVTLVKRAKFMLYSGEFITLCSTKYSAMLGNKNRKLWERRTRLPWRGKWGEAHCVTLAWTVCAERTPKIRLSSDVVGSEQVCLKADLHGAILSHATSLRHAYDTYRIV